jgi:hypothetical protein
MLPEARWVKAFNTVHFKTLQSEAHRSGEHIGLPRNPMEPYGAGTLVRL